MYTKNGLKLKEGSEGTIYKVVAELRRKQDGMYGCCWELGGKGYKKVRRLRQGEYNIKGNDTEDKKNVENQY